MDEIKPESEYPTEYSTPGFSTVDPNAIFVPYTEGEEPKPPEPAVVRGLLVALLGLIGAVVGKQLDASWIDDFLTAYMVVAPLALAWWIRRHVTPFKRGSE